MPGHAHGMVAVHYAAVQAVGAEFYPEQVIRAWSHEPDENRRAWLAGIIEKDSTLCCLALVEDSCVVGFCLAFPEQGRLQALYVHPDFSGQGIGQHLLMKIEASCKKLGVQVLELNASLNAAPFYRRNGFTALGPAHLRLAEGISMQAIHMQKHLS